MGINKETGLKLSSAERRRGIIGAISCIAIFAFTIGLTLPLISLILDRDGWDTTIVGLHAATYAFAMVIVSPFTPRLAQKFGSAKLMGVCLASIAISVLLFPVVPDIIVWLGLRVVIGAAATVLFILGEAWINDIADELRRGRTVGIYMAVLSAGYGAGPLVIPLTGIDGYLPFIIAGVGVAAAGVPLMWAANTGPRFDARLTLPVFRFVQQVSHLLVAVLVLGVIFGAAESLLPVYATHEGYSTSFAAVILSVLVFGNIVLQFPLGMYADKISRETLFLLCGIGTLIGSVLLPIFIHTIYLLLPVLFIWGGCTLGLFTLAMTLLGQRFSGSDLVLGSALFGMAFGAGSIFGPVLAGGAMDIWGTIGLPIIMVGASTLFVVVALARYHAHFVRFR